MSESQGMAKPQGSSGSPAGQGEPEPRVSDRPGKGRVVARVSGRAVAGLLGTALAAAVIGAASVLPLPSMRTAPPSATVQPASVAQQRVCPGPLLHLGDASGKDTSTITSSGKPTVSSSAAGGMVAVGSLTTTDNQTKTLPALLSLPASGTDASLAASQSQAIADGDLVGFAAAACGEASTTAWLVGGSTATGRTTLVTLSNPTDVTATVDLTIYTDKGKVAAPGSTGIVVPPLTQRILPLTGFALGTESIVVEVQSRDGRILANLQQSIIRTLEPGGVDIVAPTTNPATVTVIPGVVVANTIGRLQRASEPGFHDLQTTLRMLVPGPRDVTATMEIRPEGSTTAGTVFTIDLAAGKVVDVPIDIPSDGNYTVTVTAALPLVASVNVFSVGADGQTDFAWLAGAPILSQPTRVSIPAGPSPTLHLVNPTAAAVTVQVESAGGNTPVSLPPHGSAAVPAATGWYLLSGFDELLASVSFMGDGVASGYVVAPPQPAAERITVYP